ncbi:flagellar motor switch phosphatase FliY [Hathewaya limosa]|uniref:Flagellar motor switch protein FliN/FliY n=1 Tax=Hathewaya limosa TaxID=1536 RepID=A0ABU0JQ57_HATLI|nr:flagellar motor switch phosphatase FliY [Hathewaya limosa]MDQ0479224.1 flagellar motor switch protein FliN/FliY [Hathewaya limosa]
MNNGFLSQEEINALLNGGNDTENSGSMPVEEANNNEDLTNIEKDILGEVGNISMGSASTALSTIIGQPVNITTPTVSTTTLNKMRNEFEIPNVALDVKYTSGIAGSNLFVMKITDAAVIANLMMGGDGKIEEKPTELSELEISAVSEAMNQMIGSAATSMATMFTREVNISPPTSKVWDDQTVDFSQCIDGDEEIVRVSFRMTIGDLVDSNIMQILPMDTTKTIINIMMGNEQKGNNAQVSAKSVEEQLPVQNNQPIYEEPVRQQPVYETPAPNYTQAPVYEKPIERAPVNVQQATFAPLQGTGVQDVPRNIDLILDVPLNISVVLGRSKKNIKDILELGVGSLIELDKLAEEPVEILVNGKKIAYGEVVVVDENFGVRITSIISSEDRVRSLGK